MIFINYKYVLLAIFIPLTITLIFLFNGTEFVYVSGLTESQSLDSMIGLLGYSLLFGAVGSASITAVIYALGIIQSPSKRLYPDIKPVSEDELKSRLLSLNNPSNPWEIVEDGPYLLARWKIVDSKWWEILKRAGLRSYYLGKMKLVDRSKMVLYTEEMSELEWSVGVSGEPFSISYSKFKGRVIFSKKRAAAYAFKKLAPPDWGKVYDYDFDVNKIRGPIIETVERSGWLFQPVTRI